MKDELNKLAQEMREVGTNAMNKWAERLESIANAAQGEPVGELVAEVEYVAGDLTVVWLVDPYSLPGTKLYAAPPSDSTQVLVEALEFNEKVAELLYDKLNKTLGICYERLGSGDGKTPDGLFVQMGDLVLGMAAKSRDALAAHCGQNDVGQYGEHPCERCGLSRTWGIAPPSDSARVLVGVLKQKLEYFQEMKKISDMEAKAINFEWDSGYAVGQKVAYEDAVDELQELIKSITGVPTEPKS